MVQQIGNSPIDLLLSPETSTKIFKMFPGKHFRQFQRTLRLFSNRFYPNLFSILTFYYARAQHCQNG